MNKAKEKTRVCDSCRREVPESEITFLPMKMCCGMQRVPLCRSCRESMERKAARS